MTTVTVKRLCGFFNGETLRKFHNENSNIFVEIIVGTICLFTQNTITGNFLYFHSKISFCQSSFPDMMFVLTSLWFFFERGRKGRINRTKVFV